MTRVLVCSALQIAFVVFYGAWALFRPAAAFEWMLPFVGCVILLVIYNSLDPIREALQTRRAR